MDIILKDVEDFDPRLWLYAVSISVSAVVILGLSVCVMLLRDHFLDLEIKRQQGKVLILSEFDVLILF